MNVQDFSQATTKAQVQDIQKCVSELEMKLMVMDKSKLEADSKKTLEEVYLLIVEAYTKL